MALLNSLPTFQQTAMGAVLLYIAYYIHWQLTVGARRRAIIKAHGCKPIKKSAKYNSFPNNIWGFKTYNENIEALKEHKVLEMIGKRLEGNGNTLSYRMLNGNFVMTMEPKNLQAILAHNFEDWGYGSRRRRIFSQVLGSGIFTSDGARWKHSRELLRPSFSKDQIADLPMLEKHVKNLINLIPHDGSMVNLQELFHRLTTDFSTELLFGESINLLHPEKSDPEFAHRFDKSLMTVAHVFRAGAVAEFFYFHFNKTFRRDVDFIENFVDRFVRQGYEYRNQLELEKKDPEKAADDRYIFLQEVVKRTNDAKQIRTECLNIFIAGRDTTANLLSHLWFQLARRPDIWAKLKAEIDELEGEVPDFTYLKNMKYLKWCLNETLRLFPIVPTNSRCAVRDTVLPLGGGEDGKSPILIPEGQNVQWTLYSMHRRKDLYGPDAEEYHPERWENMRPGWEFLPFNGGPRICLGQQLALAEAGYVTVRLMQQFKGGVVPRDDKAWMEFLQLTCGIWQGCKVGMFQD